MEAREKLGPRDRGVLAAHEALAERDPPDRAEFGRRLVALAEKFPNDSEIAMLAAHGGGLDHPQRIALGLRATEIDPEYPDAWPDARPRLPRRRTRGRVARRARQVHRARLGRLRRSRVREHSIRGDCGASEEDARRRISRSTDAIEG